MPVMLKRWNDDKMDSLAAKVDGIEAQLREQRQELHELRQDTKAGFERMSRLLAQGAIGLSGSIIVGFATVLATQLS
jgi:hypothetical protein